MDPPHANMVPNSTTSLRNSAIVVLFMKEVDCTAPLSKGNACGIYKFIEYTAFSYERAMHPFHHAE